MSDSPEKTLQLKKGVGWYVTDDNISHAQAARTARQRISRGSGTPEDYALVNGREALLKKAVEDKND